MTNTMNNADEWPPSPDEMLENPELIEAVRETDPDYFYEVAEDYPELTEYGE
jgi:hypothetical protein